MFDTILNIDKSLFLYLNRDMGQFADNFFWYVSQNYTWIPLYVIILYFVYRRVGLKKMFIFLAVVAVTVIVADQVCNIFKYGFKKFRPTYTPDIQALVHTVRGYRGGPYGTFSAHCATCFSIAYLASKMFNNRWFSIFIFFWACVVAYSRIYLGVHFPLDLIFGTATGLIFGYLGSKVLHNLEIL